MALARHLMSKLTGQGSKPNGRGLKAVLAAAVCFALLSVLPYVGAWLQSRYRVRSWTWDLDVMLLRGGLFKARHFRDTLSWWTGTWVGQVPFYRPLTSYLFWAEWKAFGDEEWLYVLPDFAAHITATILFA